MSKVRPSTQLALDGAGVGDAMVVDPTGTFWTHGVPTSGPSAYNETNLGISSIDGAGNVLLTYTTFYGIDTATGQPYYDAAGPVTGEEAVIVIGLDGSINLVQPRG